MVLKVVSKGEGALVELIVERVIAVMERDEGEGVGEESQVLPSHDPLLPGIPY